MQPAVFWQSSPAAGKTVEEGVLHMGQRRIHHHGLSCQAAPGATAAVCASRQTSLPEVTSLSIW